MKRKVGNRGAGRASGPAQPRVGIRRIARLVRDEARGPAAYLVPVRIFIGLGWLRAGVEKFVATGWRDGSSLAAFLTHQLQADAIAFPFYEWLATNLFLHHAAVLGQVVVVGQLLAGLAIVSGTFTSPALLAGMFMNVNFLLAGVPDPSAFYIVIQLALFATAAGSTLGIDGWLFRARPASTGPKRGLLHRELPQVRVPRPLYPALAAFALLAAIVAFRYITVFSPGGIVEDPAAIAVVLLGVVNAYWLITYLRLPPRAPRRHRSEHARHEG